MNLRRLQTFIEVVDRRSFSEAAIRLGLTQSAVSKQVKILEQELGAHLLRRDQLSIELTEAGAQVYQGGLHILEKWADLKRSCSSYQSELTGVLRIGASTIPGTYLIPQVVKKFRDTYPHIDITIAVEPSESILKRLHQGYFDVAIVGVQPKQEHYRTQFLLSDQMTLIAPPDTQTQSIQVEDLKKLPMIGREAGSGSQLAVEAALLSQFGIHSHELHYVARVVDTVTLIAMVEAGVGYGFVSSLATLKTSAKVVLQLEKPRGIYLNFADELIQDPLIMAFSSMLLEVFHHAAGLEE